MPASETTAVTRRIGAPFLWASVLLLIYLLLVGVATIGAGFKWVSGGAEGAAEIFAFASSPVVGVILGTLATALVQSSSTVTSVIVGLVAGGVPVEVAVPMIMGANMGTTITNTIVSLGNLGERQAFRRSFEAATVHDFFNLYSILVFLPLEATLHPLERSAAWLARGLRGSEDASLTGIDLVAAATRPPAALLVDALHLLPATAGGLLTIFLGICMVITAVIYLGKQLRRAMTGRARGIIDLAIGRGPLNGIASGTVVTVLVQSSSTTTSLVVPLAGAGVLTTRQIYPFTLGANIGTCVTALLAATSISGVNEFFALQIALVHLLYNLLGVTLFMLVPWLRELPPRSAAWLGRRVELHRGWALGYLGGVFFVIPGAVFSAQLLFEDTPPAPLCVGPPDRCAVAAQPAAAS